MSVQTDVSRLYVVYVSSGLCAGRESSSYGLYPTRASVHRPAHPIVHFEVPKARSAARSSASMARQWGAALTVAVTAALLACSSCAAVWSPRLKETPLSFSARDHALLQGAEGPERVAGYFQLKRKWVALVRSFLIEMPNWAVRLSSTCKVTRLAGCVGSK